MRVGARICFLACWLAGFPAAAQTDPFGQLAGAYLVQAGDRDLWAGRADERRPPASLTKVMTALIVLENHRPAQVVTVSRRAARAPGSRLKLKAGDKFSVGALLDAMLMASANDACAALAQFDAGNIRAFVAKMNLRARALGLANTHFANPCGFDAPGHYSSANDLARIARTALAHPQFAAAVARTEATVTTIEGKRRFHLRNRNALIGHYAPAIGVKTGYTSKAGRCLIALARKDGVQVMLVMLDAKSRWRDTIGVIEHAFDEAGRNAAQ
jgi:D-alanyl-D-alanine carboxypeptidase (penicillin-binding protein 5/6)